MLGINQAANIDDFAPQFLLYGQAHDGYFKKCDNQYYEQNKQLSLLLPT